MPATYEPIATTTLGAAANSIIFSSIPAGFTDLVLVLTGTVSAANTPQMRLNDINAGDPYSFTHLAGDGSSASSNRLANRSKIILIRNENWSTTIPSMIIVNLFDYRSSINKTALIESVSDKNGSGLVERGVALSRITGAITRIDVGFLGEVEEFKIGTTATLYGILKA
jgi:hypothetical protein